MQGLGVTDKRARVSLFDVKSLGQLVPWVKEGSLEGEIDPKWKKDFEESSSESF